MTLTYPGCPESITVDGAYIDNINVFKALPESTKDKISDLLWDVVNG